MNFFIESDLDLRVEYGRNFAYHEKGIIYHVIWYYIKNIPSTNEIPQSYLIYLRFYFYYYSSILNYIRTGKLF